MKGDSLGSVRQRQAVTKANQAETLGLESPVGEIRKLMGIETAMGQYLEKRACVHAHKAWTRVCKCI